MAGDKLPNGLAQMAVTTAALSFSLTAITPGAISRGDLPDTTTNDNVDNRSKGKRKFKDYESWTFTAAFKQTDYEAAKSLVGVQDTYTMTDVEGSTDVFVGDMASFTPGEMTEDGFPTAEIVVDVITGDYGDSETIITVAP